MFANRLRSLRVNKKLSQQYMADLLGITRQGYAKYENPDEKSGSQPDFKTLEVLANFFDVTIDFLVTGKEEEHTAVVYGKEIKFSSDEFKVFEELKKYPILFNDLATDPEKKIKELIKLQKAKKLLFDDEDEENGGGFGDFED